MAPYRDPGRISRVMGMLRTRHISYADRSFARLLCEIAGDNDIFMIEDTNLAEATTRFKDEYFDPGVGEVVKHCALSGKLMSTLENIWRAHPELRLGQLVANATPPNTPTYKMSDELLLEQLESLYMEGATHGPKARNQALEGSSDRSEATGNHPRHSR